MYLSKDENKMNHDKHLSTDYKITADHININTEENKNISDIKLKQKEIIFHYDEHKIQIHRTDKQINIDDKFIKKDKVMMKFESFEIQNDMDEILKKNNNKNYKSKEKTAFNDDKKTQKRESENIEML